MLCSCTYMATVNATGLISDGRRGEVRWAWSRTPSLTVSECRVKFRALDESRDLKFCYREIKFWTINFGIMTTIDDLLSRLIQALLHSARHNYLVLKGHGLATTDMTTEFRRLQMLLRCPSEVMWQDGQTTKSRRSRDTGVSDAATTAAFTSHTEHINFEQLLHFPDVSYKPTREGANNLHSFMSGMHHKECDTIRWKSLTYGGLQSWVWPSLI